MIPSALALLPLISVHAMRVTEVQVRLAYREGSCIVEMAGETFSLPRDRSDSPEQKRLETTLAAMSGRDMKLRIGPIDRDAPYRCIGGLIYLAQVAGVVVDASAVMSAGQ